MSAVEETTSSSASGERAADADLVGQYLADIGGTPLLSAAEEVALARRIEAGAYAAELLRAGDDLDVERRRDLRVVAEDGKRAKEHMIRANLRLVVSVARRHSFRGLPFLDVVQEGNLGLIRAVEKFDYQHGFKFSTYATWWIRQAIERGLAEQSRTIRVPVHVVEELNRIAKATRELRTRLDREPTPEEVADAAGTTAGKVVDLREADRVMISLNAPIGEDGAASVADLVQDADTAQAHEAVEREGLAAELRALVSTLTIREARIMALRYGLADGRPHTLQEVAAEVGLTKERVRQLEMQSLRLLRDPEHSRALLAWTG